MKPGKLWLYIISLFLLSCLVVEGLSSMELYRRWNSPYYFRQMRITEGVMEPLAEKYGYGSRSFIEGVTEKMLQFQFNPDEQQKVHSKGILWYKLLQKPLWSRYYSWYETILKDLECFPVPGDQQGQETVSFDNSWMGERTYGGKRFHEGCDIMTSNNVRGYFPVVSMTGGVVEQIGWLEKGGYRVGVRSPSGAYFYYAHLYDYAEGLEKGDVVTPGQMLGHMGDSGYGKLEGTVGKFDVHLHVGIYYDVDGQEISVNPYYLLKYLKNK